MSSTVTRPGGRPPSHDEPGPTAPAPPVDPHRPAGGAWIRPDVQALRAVAILLVVAYHVGLPHLPGGYVGVDIFFVVSGYVITGQLDRELAATGRLSIGRFYARRAMRLLPAATLVTVATLAATWYWLPAPRWRSVGQDALSAAGYLLNYRLIRTGEDYRTAGVAPSPLQHFWSLAVEEQFYLVLPLLMLVTLAWWGRRSAFAALAGLITLASFGWSVSDTGRDAVGSYYGTPGRAWEFGVGVLIAIVPRALAGPGRVTAAALRWTGLVMIAAAAVRFDAATPYPGQHAALPVLGTAAVIVAGRTHPGRLLSGQLLGHLGARSYSWYLWHWPVLLIGPFALSRAFDLRDRLIAAGIALALATVTFELVEQPIRTHRRLRARPALAAVVGLVLTGATLACALLLPTLPPRLSLGLGSVAAVALDQGGSTGTRALERDLERATRTPDLPGNLRPTLAQAPDDDPEIYRDGCHLGFAAVTTPARCESLADASSSTVMVLFGDSHAAQWYPALDRIARERHWRLAVFTKSACAAADVRIFLPALKRPYDECGTWRARAWDRIRALHPALVVASSNADGGDPLGTSGSADEVWATAWAGTIHRLRAPGTRVVYLNDTPWPKQNVPDCLALHPHDVQRCARDTVTATRSTRRPLMADAAARAGATVVDPTPWLCTLSSCPVVLGTYLVYHDASHLSTVYARFLAPLLAEQVLPPNAGPASPTPGQPGR